MKEYKVKTRSGHTLTLLAKSRGNAIKEGSKIMKTRVEVVDNLTIKR